MVRMSARGALPADEVQRRLESAVQEITAALERDFYQFVVNDTFRHTANRVDALIQSGVSEDSEQAAAQEVARQVLNDTKQYLSNVH